MIVVCGIPTETPVAMVLAALEELRLPHVVLHQRRFMDLPMHIEMVNGHPRGGLLVDGSYISCNDVTGIYTRLIDWRMLPEVDVAAQPVLWRCQLWHETLTNWIELAPGCVMNRAAAMGSNQSKPYQAQLITQVGFRTPETMITNDPDLVREFQAAHGRVVYKSISGVRSIVRMLDQEAMRRLPLIRWCPVQFQRYIVGINVRVHVVAGELFATRIDTDRVDYRYATRDGGTANLAPYTLSAHVSNQCLALAEWLGLKLAGIDLLIAEDGETYCFEVNPSPAFSFYQHHTGQPIAKAIARALARDSR